MSRALALAWLLALGACVAVEPARIPPTAPASGHRAKTPQGVDLIYDPAHGAYAVAGEPGYYWVDQRFFRRGAEGWLVAPALDGPWTACESGELPPGLRTQEAR